MKKGEKIYRKLKKQGLSDKEIAESFVLPSDLTKKEKAESDKELSKILKKNRTKMKQMDYFLSDKFKIDFHKQVQKDTWEKGFPMVYRRENGDIIKHFKSGAVRIIKKAK